MNKLRKELGIDEYLELVKEDKNLNMGYVSFAQYMDILEKENQQLKEQLEQLNQPQIFIDTMDMEERYGYGLENDYLRDKLKQRDEVIDEAISFIEQTVTSDVGFNSDGKVIHYHQLNEDETSELLEILKKYEGDNNE